MTRRLLPLAAATLSLTTLAAGALLAPAASASRSADSTQERRTTTTQIANASWSTGADFSRGRLVGLRPGNGDVRISTPRTRRIAGRTYEAGIWTSPWTTPGFQATSLIPSWEAATPGQSLVRIQLRARTTDGTRGSWDTVADWSQRSRHIPRTTRSGQADDLGRVDVDTWVASSSVAAWQVRVLLLRPPASGKNVRLERVGAVASAVAPPPATTSHVGRAAGTVLPVPSYSQMVHEGHYPEWGGGGEAWCSPTSLAMVLAYHGIHPKPTGITPGHVDAVVDHTARQVYDHGYDGTGNWAFNTAYAARLVRGDSYVTRLRDLRATEQFINAGVPLIVSIAFGRGQLTGAPISASNGHLLVVAGFDRAGNVVVNDPAGRTNAEVRRTYDRAEFERLWLQASGGTAYVVRND